MFFKGNKPSSEMLTSLSQKQKWVKTLWVFGPQELFDYLDIRYWIFQTDVNSFKCPLIRRTITFGLKIRGKKLQEIAERLYIHLRILLHIVVPKST